LSTGLTGPQSIALIDGVEGELQQIRLAVQQPEAFQFTITGRDADIPVRIENTGDTPLTVNVRLEAEKLSFPADEIEAVLLPNAITSVPIPVTARSNGAFPVVVEVLTPAGNQLTEPVELTARVSTLAGLGRVFTVGALLVLATWWYSYFRRRHRAGRQHALHATRARHPAEQTAGANSELSSIMSPDAASVAIGHGVPNGDRHPHHVTDLDTDRGAEDATGASED
jgi:hypothetical protein